MLTMRAALKPLPDSIQIGCTSFQLAVIEVLVEKAIHCALEQKVDKICMAGGVSANSLLREMMQEKAKENGLALYYPAPILCTDNAAMIGSMAYYNYINGVKSDLYLNAVPGLKIGSR